MRNFPDTFERRKGLFISAFSICMTVPLKQYKCLKLGYRRLMEYYLMEF